MPMEKSLFDKFIMGGMLGKRMIGRPIKYNIRNRGYQGWVELVFSPRNRPEEFMSQAIKLIHPYLFFITYRFHVEKARDGGFRVEDVYCNKFHKEPYIMMHLYAQYFHPHTMLERVRNVRFYRQPRTLFKGFKVPDWATAKEHDGWEYDAYSRTAWDNAMHDLHSEWTPMQFQGESRQEPNPLQWLRNEQFGKGFSARLFYNEKPQPTWYRHGGHLLENSESEAERDKKLHSFTYADQQSKIVFGMDTATEEGRAAFRAEYETLAELAPEIIKMENLQFPHEFEATAVNEPHFRRVWQHYRDHTMRKAVLQAKDNGVISKEDYETASKWVGMTGHPSFSLYIMARTGQLEHLSADPGFQAMVRVANAIGLGQVEFNPHTSAEPNEDAFWNQFDIIYQLTEESMQEELPHFVTDPSNRAAVEALMNKQTAIAN